jgi:Fur family peroxide stress response transcriptional regulator
MKPEPGSPEALTLDLLREARLRLTPQRLAVVRAVLTRNHPTVNEIYAAVRAEFPTLALATVYSTLHALGERGLVRPLPFGNAVRYDVNLRPHANLVCLQCGQIADLESGEDVLRLLRERAGREVGFRLQQERIDLYGVCRTCQATPVATS